VAEHFADEKERHPVSDREAGKTVPQVMHEEEEVRKPSWRAAGYDACLIGQDRVRFRKSVVSCATD